jgi:hypothetical protein
MHNKPLLRFARGLHSHSFNFRTLGVIVFMVSMPSGPCESADSIPGRIRTQPGDSHSSGTFWVAGSEQSQEVDPIHSAVRQRLRTSVQSNWYDAKSEQLVRPKFFPAREAQVPGDLEWPKQKKRRVATPRFPGSSGNDWTVIVGIIAGLILVGLIVLAYRLRGLPGLMTFPTRQRQVTPVPARAEELPFELPQTREGLLSLARQLADRGNYHQAIVPFYGYQLLHLDFHGRIRLTRGKTNRQYLREIKGVEPLATILLNSILVFERAFFGGQFVSRDDFEQCWAQLDIFHQSTPLAEEPHDAMVAP